MTDSLVQSVLLGLKTIEIGHSVDSTSNFRRICPSEDVYPIPLMTTSPSRQFYGTDRLIYAIMYLQVHRVRELLIEYLDNNLIEELYSYRNGYKQNLCHMICTVNHPTNLYYYNGSNYEKYDQIFKLFVTLIPNLERFDIVDTFDRTPLDNCIYCGHLHYALALLNHGFAIDLDNPKYADKSYILDRNIRARNFVNNFLKTHRARKVISSQLKSKLLSIVDSCPISLNKIRNPVFLEDGQAYEFETLYSYFMSDCNNSPVTRQPIKTIVYSPIDLSFTHFH